MTRPPSIRRNCPICGSRDDSRVFAKDTYDPALLNSYSFASRKIPEYMHHRLLECPGCDLLYSSPLPKRVNFSRSYQEASYDSSEESHFAAKTYARLLPPLLRRHPDRRGALDIGAGDGAFLEELLDLGFTNVVGVEPSLAPVRAASPRIRSHLRHAFFHGDRFRRSSLSLVSCFQTVEHVDDPLGICRAALRILRPGGALLVVAHNRRSLSARVLGSKSPIYDIEHLQLFSPRSATEMFHRAGFDPVETFSITNRYPLHYWMKLLPFPKTFKERVLNVMRKSAWGRMPISLPAGNMAIIGYKKS